MVYNGGMLEQNFGALRFFAFILPILAILPYFFLQLPKLHEKTGWED